MARAAERLAHEDCGDRMLVMGHHTFAWRSVASVVGLFFVTGCLETSGTAPLRSPSNDYRPPPPTTSDGQVIGADRKPPADKLAEGPSDHGAAPGWKVDSTGISYDPRARVGGEIDRSGTKAAGPLSPPKTKPTTAK
jgi:hypothetical protein